MALDKLVDSTQLDADLTTVANAIRTKGGTSAQLSFPSGMAAAIAAIPSGREEAPSRDIDFYDYDGFRVASWTLDELASKTELPPFPTHTGLVPDGWNWTLQEIKNWGYPCDVGAQYDTEDHNWHMFVEADDVWRTFGIHADTFYTVDFGDGTVITATDTSYYKVVEHTYSTPGLYHVIVKPPANQTIAYPGVTSASLYMIKEIWSSSKLISIPILGNRCEAIAVNSNNMLYNSTSSMNIEYITIPRGNLAIRAFDKASIKHVSFPPVVQNLSGISWRNVNYLKRLCIPQLSSEAGINYVLDQDMYNITEFTFSGSLTTLNGSFLKYARLAKARFLGLTPLTFSSAALASVLSEFRALIPYDSTAYLTATNYPSPATYPYIGFGRFAAGTVLPSISTDGSYAMTWYETEYDAYNQLSPITAAAGKENYCRYTEVQT